MYCNLAYVGRDVIMCVTKDHRRNNASGFILRRHFFVKEIQQHFLVKFSSIPLGKSQFSWRKEHKWAWTLSTVPVKNWFKNQNINWWNSQILSSIIQIHQLAFLHAFFNVFFSAYDFIFHVTSLNSGTKWLYPNNV